MPSKPHVPQKDVRTTMPIRNDGRFDEFNGVAKEIFEIGDEVEFDEMASTPLHSRARSLSRKPSIDVKAGTE